MAVAPKKDVQEILREHEEALSVALESVNSLEELAGSLCHHQVISYEEHKNFLSLDPNPDHLDPALKARYLLHVSLLNINNSQRRKSKVIQFIKVLSSNQVMKDIAYSLLNAINEQEGDEYNDPKTSISCGDDIIIVLEMHVHLLAEVLQDVSHKWEQIGIALNLRRSVIEEGRNCSSNSLKLYQILLQWYNRIVPANLKTLQEALKSKIVDEVAVSKSFIEEYRKKVRAINLHQTYEIKSKRKYSHTTVGSNDIEVLDGKSTIFEAKMTTNKLEEYHWFKDGEPLDDGLKYNGVCQKMLLIKHACQGISGVYSCNIENIESMRKTLKVNFTLEKLSLLKIYSRIPEISNNSWPPVGTSSFITLALINEKRPINRIHDDSVRGDMDDILREKTIEPYKSLFQKYEEGALILIEGRPGSGKTTLTRKLSKDWATKPDILIGANLVFLISLRALKITGEENLTLSFILEPYYSSTNQLKKLVDVIEKENGKDCCFIVDGLDEYRDRDTSDNLIHKLVSKKYLQNAMVIVASRPIGSVNLRRREKISKRIEVLGFSQESIFGYIDSYFLQNEQDSQKGDELKQYLKTHINLLHMCYLPVHAAMICYIYEQPIEDIPVTETKMYEYFTLLTIKRKLECDGNPQEYNALSELDGNICESFQKVCKLAFNMTMESKQTIILSGTNATLSENYSDVHSLGLVTIDKTAQLFRVKDVYSFLHLTFQEFLTAYYIQKCTVEEQKKIIIANIENKDMLNVWKFYCGSSTFDSQKTCLIELMKSQHFNDLYKLQCAFESQQKEVCDSIFRNRKTRNLRFDDHTFLPIDLNALAYTYKQTATPVNELIFNECILSETEAQIFLDKIKNERLDHIKSLCFSINTQNIELFKAIRLLLNKFQYLNNFELKNTEIGLEEVDILTDDIKLPQLRYLEIQMPLKDAGNSWQCKCEEALKRISFNSQKLEEVRYTYNLFCKETHKKCLIHLLNSFKCKIKPLCDFPTNIMSNIDTKLEWVFAFLTVPHLLLVNCNLVDSDLEHLRNLNSEYMETLQLDFNKITCRGANILSHCLKHSPNLTLMSVSCNKIGNDGAIIIAHSLQPSSKLLELNLEGNQFGYPGTHALAEAADKMCGDFRLKLSTCYISGTDRTKLQNISAKVEMDKERSVDMFKSISLSHPEPIERAIRCYENMPTLNLSNRRLCKSGPEALGKNFKNCQFLQILVLSNLSLRTTNGFFREICFCSNLRILDLSCNYISKENIENSMEGLKLCINLKELNLSRNSLVNEGLEYLAYYLKDIKLETINLSGNKITDDGAAALARWLRIGKRVHKYQPDTFSSKYETISTFLCHNLNTHVERNGHDGTSYARQGHQWYSSLVQLDLSDNKIKCEGAAALSYGLKYCCKLEILNLQCNEIEKNGGELLLKGLKECPLLKTLNLDNNQLSNIDEQFWGTERLSHLQVLSLSNTNISEITEVEAKNLLQGLSCCTNLRILNLENNKINLRGAKAVQQAMKSLTKLEEVRIGNLGRNCGIVMKGIKNSYKLNILHLQKNALDLGCFKLLAKGVKHDQLADLKLTQVKLHKVQGAEFLSQGLTHCPKLQILDLSDNELDSKDIQILSNGIAMCRELIKLELSINKIDSDGVKHLAEGIKSFSNLRWISVSKNEIDSEGVPALMKGLMHCIGMERLEFNHNNIGAKGAATVANWIRSISIRQPQQTSSLLVLNLAKNDIKADGAKVIASALTFCKSLNFLSISHNDISSRASQSLADGLKYCSQLHTLILSNNRFGESVAVLGEGLRYCQSLKRLSLSYNKIEKEETLTDCVRYNDRLKYLRLDEHFNEYELDLKHILPMCSIDCRD